MKTFIVALILLFVLNSATRLAAQDFSAAAELVVPTGDFSNTSSLGFGATLRFENPMGKRMSWLITGGGLYTPGKSSYGFQLPAITLIPVQTGIKYYFEEQMKGFYASAEIGFHHLISSAISGTFQGISYSFPSMSETDLSYAPGIGFHTSKGDFGFRYNIISPSSGSNGTYFGIRMAVILNPR
jgi:hypothetical protein